MFKFLICLLIPPLGVYLKNQDKTQIILNVILWILGWAPAVVHAVLVPDLKEKERLEAKREMRMLSPDQKILMLSEDNSVMTVKDVVLHTGLSIDQADASLNYLAEKNMASRRVTNDGKIKYYFGNMERSRARKLTDKQVFVAMRLKGGKISSYQLAALTGVSEPIAKKKLNKMTVDSKLHSYVSDDGQHLYEFLE